MHFDHYGPLSNPDKSSNILFILVTTFENHDIEITYIKAYLVLLKRCLKPRISFEPFFVTLASPKRVMLIVDVLSLLTNELQHLDALRNERHI